MGYDIIYIAGPVIMTLVFLALTCISKPNKWNFMRNMFFMATLISLLLTLNISLTILKNGEYVVDTTILDAATNTTSYTYIQKAPTINGPDVDNMYLLISTVLYLVFAYTIFMLLANMLIFTWNASCRYIGAEPIIFNQDDEV